MSQRNPMNERYTGEKPIGKTRKSAASAKPSSERAATVRDPSPKTKKQKRQEQRERERRIAERRGVTSSSSRGGVYEVPTAEYKKWRRRWWIALGIGIAFALPSFFIAQTDLPQWMIFVLLGCSWAGLIGALYIDLGKMRKIRKQYNLDASQGKSKAARAQQKARAAEAREQRKEAEEAKKRAQEEGANAEPEKMSFFQRFKKTKLR